MTFALGIPHALWKVERQKSLTRLVDSLTMTPREVVDHRIFSDRAPNWIWSEQMWKWATETDATHFLTLQDDAMVCPDFWGHLSRMVGTMHDQVIGLESIHPKSSEVEGCWYTTRDCLVGVGYVVPMRVLQEFLMWRRTLRKGAFETVTEDTMLGLYCFVNDIPIWHPVPTIIDHDLEIASTYGNDQHKHRRPYVTWKERELPENWMPGVDVPSFGRFYESTPRLARRWIPDATEQDFLRWIQP